MSGGGNEQISVRCHSGYTYAQRPVSFTHQSIDHQVERVVRENKIPDGAQFLVETESGQVFELTFSELTGDWQIRIV